ncbi:hypothetical protein [Mesorhizobium sp. B2-6-2]|uniref:hypothetical protein n=1 Tax=Mesorhizobium sp. B2-6-2 TaxID=2589915 RepID=UPI0011280FF9|nr:hypothetical protein [Mesorhizobium sp. B2-6-2]TPJ77055.1 hypothetical protein FJ419_16115 [Mesorhizobium sp. B2-6-2]
MDKLAHPFRVIHGGGQVPARWLDIPSAVIGRSPYRRDENVVYRIAQHDARKALELGRKQPLLDLWSVVLGEIPPVNNALAKWGKVAEAQKLSSLSSAHACFRGIKRPAGDDGTGFDFYAFVSKPAIFFVYDPDMGCVIKLAHVPDDLVHVTYVRLDYPSGRPAGKHSKVANGAIGIVTHWEFVETHNDASTLPIDFAERYRRRVW